MSIHLNVYRQEVCLNCNISLYIKKNDCICHRGGTNKYFEFPTRIFTSGPSFQRADNAVRQKNRHPGDKH